MTIPIIIDKKLSLWQQLLYSAIEDDGINFAETLKYVAKELGKTLKELAKKADIPMSTFYKMTSPEMDIRLSTLRKLIYFVIREEYQYLKHESTIGLITSRDVLDEIGQMIEFNGMKIRIKEYIANTIEEEIIQGIRAVKEGVKAIVCGPVAANTLKRVVDVPVVGIAFSKQSLIEAIQKAFPKL